MNGEALTCQELLALGAINAALPTGQVVLDSFFDSLSKGMNNRQKQTEDYYVPALNTEEVNTLETEGALIFSFLFLSGLQLLY